MVLKRALFSFLPFFLIVGCAATPPAATPSACPVPKIVETPKALAEQIVIQVSEEGFVCVVWQPEEGDGHTIRIAMRIGDGPHYGSVKINEAFYRKLRQNVASIRADSPQFAERKVWIFCGMFELGEQL